MSRPADMTALDVLAERHPHATRVRYMTGCHCMLCRAANSRYECERRAARERGEWNGLVSADRARAHLLRLRRQGVGRRAVQAASDVGNSVLYEIIAGKRTNIRARTERRILAVTADARSDGALVPGGKTQRRIKVLLEQGFSRGEIARRLGYRSPALQMKAAQLTARNAMRIERLYNQVMS